jgi:hypothetical protein
MCRVNSYRANYIAQCSYRRVLEENHYSRQTNGMRGNNSIIIIIIIIIIIETNIITVLITN